MVMTNSKIIAHTMWHLIILIIMDAPDTGPVNYMKVEIQVYNIYIHFETFLSKSDNFLLNSS